MVRIQNQDLCSTFFVHKRAVHIFTKKMVQESVNTVHQLRPKYQIQIDLHFGTRTVTTWLHICKNSELIIYTPAINIMPLNMPPRGQRRRLVKQLTWARNSWSRTSVKAETGPAESGAVCPLEHPQMPMNQLRVLPKADKSMSYICRLPLQLVRNHFVLWASGRAPETLRVWSCTLWGNMCEWSAGWLQIPQLRTWEAESVLTFALRSICPFLFDHSGLI